MDMKKLNISTLDGPNWGQYVTAIQSAFQIFDCYDVVKWEILTPTPNLTYDLLVKPTVPPTQASAADLATYNTTKAVWNKKNGQALGLMQATVSPVVWQDYNHYSVVKDLFSALEATFGKAGVPQVGQYGEDSIHQFDKFIVTNTTISRQLQSDHVKWPQ